MKSEQPRIASIDALRGADMLLLAGGAEALRAVASSGGAPRLAEQLTHAAWAQPLTCWDMVMPLFIFIVGASMPFAFAKYHARGDSKVKMLWRVLRRCVLLFLLGMLVQGQLATAAPERMSLFCNTLQAIAEGYLIAAVCMMLGGVRTQIIACVTCLALYWGALRFIPYGGHEGGRFLPQDNLAIYIDHLLQGRWQDGTPYSWILTALSFGALTLMGALGGQIIRRHARSWKAPAILLGIALICMAAGWLAAFDTPMIKHIYTTSMTLWSGGLCFMLLALFHLLFDKLPYAAKLALPLRVIGSNAILAYLLTQTPGLHGCSLWKSLCHPLFDGLASLAAPASSVLFELLSLAALYLLLHFLYLHKAYLRV